MPDSNLALQGIKELIWDDLSMLRLEVLRVSLLTIATGYFSFLESPALSLINSSRLALTQIWLPARLDSFGCQMTLDFFPLHFPHLPNLRLETWVYNDSPAISEDLTQFLINHPTI